MIDATGYCTHFCLYHTAQNYVIIPQSLAFEYDMILIPWFPPTAVLISGSNVLEAFTLNRLLSQMDGMIWFVTCVCFGSSLWRATQSKQRLNPTFTRPFTRSMSSLKVCAAATLASPCSLSSFYKVNLIHSCHAPTRVKLSFLNDLSS